MPKLDAVAVLTIDDEIVRNSFPPEYRHLIKNITQEQLGEIAGLVAKDMFEFDNYFWDKFFESVSNVAMIVLDVDLEEKCSLCKGTGIHPKSITGNGECTRCKGE